MQWVKNSLFFLGNSRWLRGLVPQALGLLRSWLSALTREQVKLPKDILICFMLLFGVWFLSPMVFSIQLVKFPTFHLKKYNPTWCRLPTYMYTKANAIIMASVVWLTNKQVLCVNFFEQIFKKNHILNLSEWLLNQHHYTQMNQNWIKNQVKTQLKQVEIGHKSRNLCLILCAIVII